MGLFSKKSQKSRLDLADLPGFSDLSAEELAELAGICRVRSFVSGTEIMKEGDTGDTMYLFLSGEVDVTKSLTLSVGRHGFKNADKSFVKLRAGTASIFGEMAMLENAPRAATVTASSDCVLYEIDRASFESLCSRDPALGVKLLRLIAALLSGRVRRVNEEVLKLTTALSIALSR